MIRMALFVLFGYLSGSVLYANFAVALFGKQGALEQSNDRNPGTANAFQYGGFGCGVVTLAGDLLKGYLPVHLYLSGALAGALAGLCTALLQTRLRVEPILSGILVSTGLYTVNYAVLGGQSNLYLQS